MSKKTNKRVSSRDVAALAGVSQATVSRVFTPGKQVSEDKRRRVLEAAESLNYKPSVIARSLIQNSTKIIGIFLKKFEDPFYSHALNLLTLKLQGLGYSVLLFDINGSHSIEDLLPIALQYQVDGILVVSAPLSSELIAECSRFETPVVMFNHEDENGNAHSVCTDIHNVGRKVAEYILSKGHKKVSFLSDTQFNTRELEAGFKAHLLNEDVQLLSFYTGDFDYSSVRETISHMLSMQNQPSAVFCCNDYTAMTVLDVATKEFGLRVPQDLSIVGFNDTPPASWPHYNLTTYRQDTEKLVNNTVDVLIDAIDNPLMPVVHRFLQGFLVERGSVACRKQF